MRRLRLPLSLALLCVLVAFAVPNAACASTPAQRMTAGINWWRSAAGLAPLHHSRKLRRSSKRRARLMMRRDFFAHPSCLCIPRFDRVGEVLELHGGRRARVARTIRRWSASGPHRHVLLSPAFRRIGAARVRGLYRGQMANIWVVRLGTK